MGLTIHSLQSKLSSNHPIVKILSRISHYSTASTNDAAYIIGGFYTLDIVAEFSDYKWTQIGSLNKGKEIQMLGVPYDTSRIT